MASPNLFLRFARMLPGSGAVLAQPGDFVLRFRQRSVAKLLRPKRKISLFYRLTKQSASFRSWTLVAPPSR